MDKVKAFLQNNTAATHWLATAGLFLFGAYFQVPQFHTYVNGLYAAMPTWGQQLLAAGVALYMWYRNGKK